MIKSIFARPVFINPQAYLVIPQLANLSMLEPIDFTSTNTYSFESLGKVESKIISAKDEYILYIDLYESYGSCVLGEFYIGPATIGSIDDFTITTNGYITTIEVGGGDSGNIVYPGLIAAWSAKGKTNDDEDRAILKDLTGNGHDITLSEFAFSEMSGYGGYGTDFNKWYFWNENSPLYETEYTFKTITCNIGGGSDYALYNSISRISRNLKLKITGFTENNAYLFIGAGGFGFKCEDGDGEYIFDVNEYKTLYPNNRDIGFKVISKESGIVYPIKKRVTIEILPEYPDALVFDGVDDKGLTNNMPIIEDYTIIVKRKLINDKGMVCAYGTLSSSNANLNYFWFEYIGRNMTTSLGYENYIEKENIPNLISYQSKNSYNGIPINNSELVKKGTKLSLGSLGGGYLTSMAFYSAYLFDRSLDEQEIKEFIRKYIDPEYLLPSEIPTPDCYYDFSLGSNDDENRETIKDQSGNGNDAKAYNIAWSGMSGYGGYDIDFKTEYQTSLNVNRVTGTLSSTKINITSVKNINAFLESGRLETHPSYKIKVTGVSDNLYLTYQYGTSNYFHIKTEGIHTIPAVETETQYVGFKASTITENCNITLELIPQYPGALVLDGTDDYIALEAFDSGFKTVFMVFKPMTNINTGFYDQIKKGEKNYYFAICGGSTGIAFSYRNTNGKTYINGKLNTSVLSKDIINKTVCIGIVNENVTPDNTISPRIGNGTHYEPYYANMVIYKFLGFKEELTEEQIQAIIKKYNLLDGVDEIEVS